MSHGRSVDSKRNWVRVVVILISMASASTATAQEQALQVIQNRIANFREMGTASKHIKDQLESKQPNLRLIQDSANLIQERGAFMLDWFPPGSEPPPSKSWFQQILDWFFSDDAAPVTDDVESHAKPVVWTQRPGFEAAFHRFDAQATQMRRVAQQGQTAAINAQFAELQQTCKGCHDVYREELD